MLPQQIPLPYPAYADQFSVQARIIRNTCLHYVPYGPEKDDD